jgi:hypothetical protein
MRRAQGGPAAADYLEGEAPAEPPFLGQRGSPGGSPSTQREKINAVGQNRLHPWS